VIAGRDCRDFAGTRRLGAARFERAVTRRGGQKPYLRILRAMFAALSDRAGVIAHRPGALERVALLAEDWQPAQDRISQIEQQMTAVVDELGLTALVTSITGLSAVGAAAVAAVAGARLGTAVGPNGTEATPLPKRAPRLKDYLVGRIG
jgi:hypothetical protein